MYNISHFIQNIGQFIPNFFSFFYILLLICFCQLFDVSSCTDHEIDENRNFKYCYMSFVACTQGWPNCTPVISIEGTYLNAKFRGMLLACGMDANN